MRRRQGLGRRGASAAAGGYSCAQPRCELARVTGECVAALSALKLAMGLAHCGSMLRVLVEFPVEFLGVLLLFADVELAVATREFSARVPRSNKLEPGRARLQLEQASSARAA
ncbi:molybdate transporter 1-like [Panicum virgatum]|uniref:molybdate transporter 1-like n=1 Tax=Panicum virgatum TaxID=38727 RepID=UPI0019D56B6E|nr:molybdate transporter 1-like [Panicum virgatum]